MRRTGRAWSSCLSPAVPTEAGRGLPAGVDFRPRPAAVAVRGWPNRLPWCLAAGDRCQAPPQVGRQTPRREPSSVKAHLAQVNGTNLVLPLPSNLSRARQHRQDGSGQLAKDSGSGLPQVARTRFTETGQLILLLLVSFCARDRAEAGTVTVISVPASGARQLCWAQHGRHRLSSRSRSKKQFGRV